MADIDSSLLWFSKQIKKKHKVILSGECADEIFGGYPWFYREEVKNREYFPWLDSIEQRELLLKPELILVLVFDSPFTNLSKNLPAIFHLFFI